MITLDSYNQYESSRKLGEKYVKNCVHKGKYPYLQVLDDIVNESMIAGKVDLDVIDVPIPRIVGTKTEGRQIAFAGNFMPILSDETEFASKWMQLCDAHTSDVGITDPIKCYEYMGWFYVQEGNKRVSVMKSFGANTIPGHVIRLVPMLSDDEETQIYYEFMDFYKLSRVYSARFRRRGGFAALQAALGFKPDHVWTDSERSHFIALFYRFRRALEKLDEKKLDITTAEALITWLQIYSINDLHKFTPDELHRSLVSIRHDLRNIILPQQIKVSLSDSPLEAKKLGGFFLKSRLNIAFVHGFSPEVSPWAAAHEEGARNMAGALGSRVWVSFYSPHDGIEDEALIQEAVNDGAEVIFVTAPTMLPACRKIAAKYPKIHILNSSVSIPFPGIRTYYCRIYEGKFIMGAIAGAMSETGNIGYIASSPTYGVPASINAFALGALMTNPRARITLSWSCVSKDPVSELIAAGVDVISNRDLPSPSSELEFWGTSHVEKDGSLTPLASPVWNCSNFYTKLVTSILNGCWDSLDAGDKAINYWWGMQSGVVDISYSPSIPRGVMQLANLLKTEISVGRLELFNRYIKTADGVIINDGGRVLSAEEILHMDWLCENVSGKIPEYDELLPMAKPMARLLGVYGDKPSLEGG